MGSYETSGEDAASFGGEQQTASHSVSAFDVQVDSRHWNHFQDTCDDLQSMAFGYMHQHS